MMNIKNHNGFTLVETLVALLITAIIFVPLFSLFNSVIFSVGLQSARIEKILYAKEFLHQSQILAKQEQSFTAQETSDPQKGILRYERKPVQTPSVFGSQTHLVREEVTISWQKLGKQKSETLVTFMFVPNQKEQHES